MVKYWLKNAVYKKIIWSHKSASFIKRANVKKSNSSSRRPEKFLSVPIWGLDSKFDDRCLNEVEIDAHTQIKIKTVLLKELKFLNDLYVTLHDYLFLTNVINIFHYIPFAAFFFTLFIRLQQWSRPTIWWPLLKESTNWCKHTIERWISRGIKILK